MSKRAAVLLASVTLVVGAFLGGWASTVFHSRFESRFAITSLTAEATTTVATLNRLRAGNTNEVVELLELKLDGALIGLGGFLSDPRELRRDPMYIEALQMAKDYRTKFPRKSASQEINQGVARAFALLDGQPQH